MRNVRKSSFPVIRPASIAVTVAIFSLISTAFAGALEDYVQKPDASFNWKFTEHSKRAVKASHLELVSQTWRGQFWSHDLYLYRPAMVRNPKIGFLFVTGDGAGDRELELIKAVGDAAGTVAAVITKVPNQPLYDGKKEDALIAYTFDRYLKTGDETWPVLFPMVKSAVRGMDTVQQYVEKEFGEKVEKFVVSGASKRGWTTWLTGAEDPRVLAIAPMVIDMLNMKAQTEWAEKMYGKQSEEISDYTDLNLIAKMDSPKMKALRSWVDPYSYRNHYTMPKLLLLGTNDPYWVVDSQRHYFGDLPGSKLIFQTPNAGHNLGGGQQAVETLSAWYQMVADGDKLPEMTWKWDYKPDGSVEASAQLNQSAKEFNLWTAESPIRDFRKAKWSSRKIDASGDSAKVLIPAADSTGYRAFLIEAMLVSPKGLPYKLSTEARVTPDGKRE
jgi:PhoPQ-activated pathogenicity-related protein